MLLDQRGTGASTPFGDADLDRGAEGIAEYVTHLRADAIVEDAEALRESLGAARWACSASRSAGSRSSAT
ncbi:MAG: hypothetical protein R2692_03715 [Microbacterium sp.]